MPHFYSGERELFSRGQFWDATDSSLSPQKLLVLPESTDGERAGVRGNPNAINLRIVLGPAGLVTPAQAAAQWAFLDSGIRRNDGSYFKLMALGQSRQ